MKAPDPERRFVELLKTHGRNEAVRIFKEERAAVMEALGRDSVASHGGGRGRAEAI